MAPPEFLSGAVESARAGLDSALVLASSAASRAAAVRLPFSGLTQTLMASGVAALLVMYGTSRVLENQTEQLQAEIRDLRGDHREWQREQRAEVNRTVERLTGLQSQYGELAGAVRANQMAIAAEHADRGELRTWLRALSDRIQRVEASAAMMRPPAQ